MMAALLRRGPRRCRSRQLTETLSFPPTNHFACGGFQSRTWLQGDIHSSDLAWSSQNRSGLWPATYSAAVAADREANSTVVGNRRCSESRVSSWSLMRSPLVDGDERPLVLSGVDLSRPGDLLVLVEQHFLPLRQPARHPAQGEEDREVLGGIAHRLIDEPRVEVHVRIQLPLDEVLVFERDPLQLERDLELGVEAGLAEHIVRHPFDELGPRVVRLVHPVAESHQPAAARLHLLDEA